LYNDVLVTHDGLMCICAKYWFKPN
jgi:hypothetical protein